jgi:hypothetical protein
MKNTRPELSRDRAGSPRHPRKTSRHGIANLFMEFVERVRFREDGGTERIFTQLVPAGARRAPMTTKKTIFGVLGFGTLGLLAACQSSQGLRAIAAGYAPCRADEIVIGNENVEHGFGSFCAEWDAWCRDEQWHCAGAGQVMNCRRVQRAVQTAGASTSSEMPAGPLPTHLVKQSRAEASWVNYVSNACGVSAKFPDEPHTSNREVTTPSGPISIETAIRMDRGPWDSTAPSSA